MGLDQGSKDNIIFGLKFLAILLSLVAIQMWVLDDSILDWACDNVHIFMVFSFVAGMFDAAKDTVAHHFSTSIFKNLNARYWNAEISWQNKYIGFHPDSPRRKWFGIVPVPVVLTDAWHLAKGLQTVFICLTAIYFVPVFCNNVYNYLAVYVCYKTAFNLFYDFILKSK